MGQISSIFDSKEGDQQDEFAYDSEEDEVFDSAAQTPLEEDDSEEDDSGFEDCNEDVTEEEEERDHRKPGSRAIACLLGNYEEDDYSDSDQDEEALEEIINLVNNQDVLSEGGLNEVEKGFQGELSKVEKKLQGELSKVEKELQGELSKVEKELQGEFKENVEGELQEGSQETLQEHLQSHSSSTLDTTINIITDADALSIINDLISGKYDDSIHTLWHTVEHSEFNVIDFGYTHFLPVLVLSKMIYLYFEKGGTSFEDISLYSALLQNYVSEWITNSREDNQHSFIGSHPDCVQYLYQQIKDIVYYLNKINEDERANRLYWILEFIDMDRMDPVTFVQTRTKDGSYHKKTGSRYDSNDHSDIGLIAMLSPQETTERLSHSSISSPNRRGSNDGSFIPNSITMTDGSDRSDNWRTAGRREYYSHRASNKNYRNGRSWTHCSSPTSGNRSRLQRVNSIKDSYRNSPSRPTYSHNLNYSSHSRTSDDRSDGGSFCGSQSHLRELQKWNSVEGEEEEHTLEELQANSNQGRTKWDQFSVNKEKFGIDADFNEALYTVPMSSLEVNDKEWKEVVDAAREMELEDDHGRHRINTEIKDGEEDSVLYSDVQIQSNLPNTQELSDENVIDTFIDKSIRK